MNARVHIGLACTLLLATACWPAAAQQTYPVDDSASQVLGSTLRLEPAPLSARGVPLYMLSGEIAVRVRLDVSPWRGRNARIYMSLPNQAGDAITARWTTRGRLLPGVLRGDKRALVYAGPITGNLLEDTLRLRITADGRRLPASEQLVFTFEIDPDSP